MKSAGSRKNGGAGKRKDAVKKKKRTRRVFPPTPKPKKVLKGGRSGRVVPQRVVSERVKGGFGTKERGKRGSEKWHKEGGGYGAWAKKTSQSSPLERSATEGDLGG